LFFEIDGRNFGAARKVKKKNEDAKYYSVPLPLQDYDFF